MRWLPLILLLCLIPAITGCQTTNKCAAYVVTLPFQMWSNGLEVERHRKEMDRIAGDPGL